MTRRNLFTLIVAALAAPFVKRQPDPISPEMTAALTARNPLLFHGPPWPRAFMGDKPALPVPPQPAVVFVGESAYVLKSDGPYRLDAEGFTPLYQPSEAVADVFRSERFIRHYRKDDDV